MSEKDLLALLVLCAITGVATIGCIVSSRLRDLCFFVGVCGLALIDRIDVNLLDTWWYRGTSRGVELTICDGLFFAVIAGCALTKRRDGLPRFLWPASIGFMVLYTSCCAVSVATSDPQLFGIGEFTKALRGVMVFLCGVVYIRTRRELVLFALALATVAGLESASSLRQRLMMGMYRVNGTVFHPNSLSMYMCLIAPILVAAVTTIKGPARWYCGLGIIAAIINVLLTLSRTGLVVFGLCTVATLLACVSWKITLRKTIAALLLTAAAGMVVFSFWGKIMERYHSASFAEEYLEVNGENRGIYLRWALMIAEERPFGVGLNNWSFWVSREYGARLEMNYADYAEIMVANGEIRSVGNYAPPAHSVFALTLGEMGWVGLSLFCLMWLRWFSLGIPFLFRRADPDFRWGIGILGALVAVFLHNVTEWNYRQTTLMFTTHLAVGALVACRWLVKRRSELPIAPAPLPAEGNYTRERVPVLVQSP